MTRTFKSLVIALSGAGFLASGAVEAQACHGRHRGGGGHARVVVVRVHRPVQHVQPVQPLVARPGIVQGASGAVGVQVQGQVAQSGNATASAITALGGQPMGVAAQGQTTVSSSQQTLFGQQPQGGSQTQFGSAPAATNFTGNAATGGQIQQQAQMQQTQFQPQTQTQIQQPTQQTAQAAQPQVQSQAQAQAPAAERNAQTMALEALSGLDTSDAVPASQAAAQSGQPGLTGNFAATLSTVGATIRLQLNADSSFTWTVSTKDGKTSNFQGSYTFNGSGLLTLARTDSRKLEASVTPTASGFSLKLVGQNASALSFVRV
jgi:hypothetical protein